MSELATQIGVKSACEVLNVPRSQLYRHRQPKVEPSPSPPDNLARQLQYRRLLICLHFDRQCKFQSSASWSQLG